MRVVRSKAPLRLGIAGGGTDVAPYSEVYGGCVLNATIDMYARCQVSEVKSEQVVMFQSLDLQKLEKFPLSLVKDVSDTKLKLHLATYKKITELYLGGKYTSLAIITDSDAPPGSGLGSSSTIVIAMIEALRAYFTLPLGEYDIASLAYEIERRDCGLSGGKQDQYAAAFGGVNFMEFHSSGHVLVNPLRINENIMWDLHSQLMLYFTGVSRYSSDIIDDQKKAVKSNDGKALLALHDVKESALRMKEHLLRGDINAMSEELSSAWDAKKRTSKSITRGNVHEVAEFAINHGAKSLKISGAGGGGFMIMFVDYSLRVELKEKLQSKGGIVHRFNFTDIGAHSWIVSR